MSNRELKPDYKGESFVVLYSTNGGKEFFFRPYLSNTRCKIGIGRNLGLGHEVVEEFRMCSGHVMAALREAIDLGFITEDGVEDFVDKFFEQPELTKPMGDTALRVLGSDAKIPYDEMFSGEVLERLTRPKGDSPSS